MNNPNFSFVVVAKLFPKTFEGVNNVFASMFKWLDDPISQRVEYNYTENIATFTLECSTLIDPMLVADFFSVVNSNLVGEKMYSLENFIPEISPTVPVRFFTIVFKSPSNFYQYIKDLHNLLSLETFGWDGCGFTVGRFDENYLVVSVYSTDKDLDELEAKLIKKITPNKIISKFKLEG